MKKYLSLALVTEKGMIVSFGDKETEKIWDGFVSRKLPNEIQQTARRKLRMINNSVDISDLKIPPANRLEKLRGNMKEFYSIRINDQWRIIFKWQKGNAMEVAITDYHSYRIYYGKIKKYISGRNSAGRVSKTNENFTIPACKRP